MHRTAAPEDAPAITRIYNEGIEGRIRLESPYPAIVVEEKNEVVAFAWTSSYSERKCHSGVVDFSVYVERGFRGRGAGRMAMEALANASEHAGFHKLTSKVFVENTPSRHLLASLGFREVGIHEKHAKLDGEWRDVVVVELSIPANLL